MGLDRDRRTATAPPIAPAPGAPPPRHRHGRRRPDNGHGAGALSDTPAAAAPPDPAAAAAAAAADPMAMLRSRSYVQLLVLAGAPRCPRLGDRLLLPQVWWPCSSSWFFTSLPEELGFAGTPAWWPVPILAVAGVLVGATIKYLPGTAGHKPAEGFKAGGAPTADRAPRGHPGLAGHPQPRRRPRPRGAADRHRRRTGRAGRPPGQAQDAPPMAAVVIAAAGSFAAISALLGSPIARRLPPHGGIRAGRPAPRPGAGTRPAGRRDRHPDLHRPRQPHRIRQLLAVHPRPAPVQPPHRGHVPVGHRLRPGRRGSGHGHPAAGPGPPAGGRTSAWWPSCRWSDWRWPAWPSCSPR